MPNPIFRARSPFSEVINRVLDPCTSTTQDARLRPAECKHTLVVKRLDRGACAATRQDLTSPVKRGRREKREVRGDHRYGPGVGHRMRGIPFKKGIAYAITS